MIADEVIINELRKSNRLLERIADTLDAQTKLLDERTEPPVVVSGEYPLPGFYGDPLAKFPSIRKDKDGK